MKMKYPEFSHEEHKKMKPIERKRHIEYEETYYICPNCGSEIKPFRLGSDGATMFFGQCTNQKCRWLF